MLQKKRVIIIKALGDARYDINSIFIGLDGAVSMSRPKGSKAQYQIIAPL